VDNLSFTATIFLLRSFSGGSKTLTSVNFPAIQHLALAREFFAPRLPLQTRLPGGSKGLETNERTSNVLGV